MLGLIRRLTADAHADYLAPLNCDHARFLRAQVR
jgi:hypothetical protein